MNNNLLFECFVVFLLSPHLFGGQKLLDASVSAVKTRETVGFTLKSIKCMRKDLLKISISQKNGKIL